MLIGTSYHTLDTQRRVTVPKGMRGSLGNSPVLTRGLDGGVFLFPENFWNKLVNNLEHQPFTKQKARNFLRLFSNDAYVVEPDKVGRITIPETLAQSFELKKDIVVVGSLQYVEIWDREKYHAHIDAIQENAEEIAESLDWEERA